MKRLFITTGSISLVNALAIIEEIKDNNTYDDTLIILSFSANEDFIETNKKIASLHNFSKILFFKTESEIKKKIDFKQYNAIYSTTCQKIYSKLNKTKKAYIFDEGPGSVITDLKKYKNIQGIYSTNYIDKLCFINVPENINISYIKTFIFNQISKKILSIFNINDKIETPKNVLFMSHYIYRNIGDEKALEFYIKYIDYFINKGYTIYFKTHPRDDKEFNNILFKIYQNNPNFKFLNNCLPIEIYDYNFDIITGSYSGTLVTLPHYKKIPAIHLPLKELYYTNLGLNFKKFFALYDEYIPSFKDMEKVISKDKSEILNEYNKLISKKLPMQTNDYLKKVLLYKPNILTKIFAALLINTIAAGNKKMKNKIKNYTYKNFYKLIQTNFTQ